MTAARRLADNLAAVRQKIAEAARRSDRPASAVTLVAVTKYAPANVASQLAQLGCTDLGESRPQELWEKAAHLKAANIRWHLIGHLQRNKVERTIPLVSLIHSADSLRLLAAIDAAAAPQTRVPVLLEVNISGDPAKHGFQPTEIEPSLPAIAALEHLEIRGLMCMAGTESDTDAARRDFAALRALRDQLQTAAPPQIQLNELSMGMSGDFEVAIEQGATIVRIGSALFEGVDLPDV